jgi:AcrR family transcriptional regulator
VYSEKSVVLTEACQLADHVTSPTVGEDPESVNPRTLARVVETASRAERKERTRQALLDAALDLLADTSLASLSLRKLTHAVGIVPTAFYKHFDSMDALGVVLVEQSMRSLRQMLREARRNPGDDLIISSVTILTRQVRANEAHFRFLTRERYGGIAAVRRAIAVELQLFTSELTIDFARMPPLADWRTEDLQMAADLMVNAMMSIVLDLLESDPRVAEDEAEVVARAERQLRLIALGMASWRRS